jgi:phenylacetate-CoA ligase
MQRIEAITLPDLYHRPPEEVIAHQNRLLGPQVELCSRAHPYYSKLLVALGIAPSGIRTVDDLEKLPVTTKTDFITDPEAFRLRADDLPQEERTVWDIMCTTGTTTGTPTPVYATTFDYSSHLFNARRYADLIDFRSGDVVAVIFPFTPFPTAAVHRVTAEATACGASSIVVMPGRPSEYLSVHRSLDETIALIESHRATVVVGHASFVRRVWIRAAELGADLSAVRTCTISGEASSPALRADISRRMREMGSPEGRIVNRYGATEMATNMVECVEGSGWHDLTADQVYLEVVDPDTGKRLPDGEVGLLTFTHLTRRGSVFLRYAIGDLTSLTYEPCPHCGRTTGRIMGSPVRTKNILKIKGTLVNLTGLQDALERVPDLDEFQIVVRKDPDDELGMDQLLIRAATKVDEHRVIDAVTDATLKIAHMRPYIEFATSDELFDPLTTMKANRILDKRPQQ